jgi:hypothetical protein
MCADDASTARDEVARLLHEYLLREAAAPYFAQLDAWLTEGVIRDPYGEFMVVFNPKVCSAASWLRRPACGPDRGRRPACATHS